MRLQISTQALAVVVSDGWAARERSNARRVIRNELRMESIIEKIDSQLGQRAEFNSEKIYVHNARSASEQAWRTV